MSLPVIPSAIRVHLGAPSEAAPDVELPFDEYIKNVASSEIYSTWETAAIRANMLCQISFALNRVYTEWYPSMGYSFDITADTGFDQKFIRGRAIYENISRIADELFNDYLRRKGSINPLFAQYCDGVQVQCEGLSQWGSQSLALEGLGAQEILRRYYGEDIELVTDAPVADNVPSYPGTPLKRGDLSENVRRMQLYLNRISVNYPAIPKLREIRGLFDEATEQAVRVFQKIFALAQDGIVGKGTWYRIIYIFDAVTRIAELEGEGIGYEGLSLQLQRPLTIGDKGGQVVTVQYFLILLSYFVDFLPQLTADGSYGSKTAEAVRAFQGYKGLEITGETDRSTWQALYGAYEGVIAYLREKNQGVSVAVQAYPGVVLRRGDVGPSVRVLREYLSYIADYFYDIASVGAGSLYDTATRNAVGQFQRIFSLRPTGETDEKTWNTIARVYRTLREGQFRVQGQYPGYELKREE